MSWLTNFLKCDSLCERDCCTSSKRTKLNREHFWSCIRKAKKQDYNFIPTNILLFEKVIYLNNDRNVRSILSIGINPQNKFKVAGRLEMKRSGSIMMLTEKHLKNLLTFLNDYEDHILRTLPVSHTTGKKYNLHMQQTQARILELSMNGMGICIDEDSLKTLCRMRFHIQHTISLTEGLSEQCESSFFNLMNHFYYGKTVKEACDLIETDYTQCFFDELMCFHCECLDTPFIVEISLHFGKWFAFCLSSFFNTLMLNESSRLKTFSSIDWPHEKDEIDVGKLARSGLYYVGVSDNTQCVFCDLVIHMWQPKDNPVLEHYKYKPTCSFLKNHKCTQNVSDVSKPSEISYMMTILNELSPSIDEVDKKHL